ncbi:DUF2079 domain-containing protein [Kribbella sp. NBC_01245]|uniref:DUF2079 domain-containing protein n=1 Tax=Kribbella sp. NBC_01245 TaxID=2903578 RepID=UPI003FA5E5C3
MKEDLGLTLAALGILLALHRPTQRLGLATAVAGCLACLVTVLLVIPAFNADGTPRTPKPPNA